MIHVDAALVEIITSKPLEYVIAGTRRDYLTYLWSCALHEDEAEFVDSVEALRQIHNAVIVLAGDRYAISPAYKPEILASMSGDNVIVFRGLGGNTRKYWND